MKNQKQLKMAILNLELTVRILKRYEDKNTNIDAMKNSVWIAEGDVLDALKFMREFMGARYGKEEKA